MQIKTKSSSSNGSNSASFSARTKGQYGTHLDGNGQLELSVSQVAGDVTFSVVGDIEETTHGAASITVRPTAKKGKGVITVHTVEGDVAVDITVGGTVVVGLMLDRL